MNHVRFISPRPEYSGCVNPFIYTPTNKFVGATYTVLFRADIPNVRDPYEIFFTPEEQTRRYCGGFALLKNTYNINSITILHN